MTEHLRGSGSPAEGLSWIPDGPVIGPEYANMLGLRNICPFQFSDLLLRKWPINSKERGCGCRFLSEVESRAKILKGPL
jgi:hypothetical protein